MSETPQFNELEELYKDLEALEEDLEDLKKKLIYSGSHQEPVRSIFSHETRPTKYIRLRQVFNRAIEEELRLERAIEEERKLKDVDRIDEDLDKWHRDKELVDFTAESMRIKQNFERGVQPFKEQIAADATRMIIKQNLEREMQILKEQISDKEKEIEDKKEEIKVEKSLTKEQIEKHS